MNIFRSFGVAVRAYGTIVHLVARPAYWLPFLLIAAVQFAILAALVNFHRPGISSVGVPVVDFLGDDRATHYPFFFLFLPMMYSKLIRVVAVVLASVTAAVGTLYFARALGLEIEGGSWRKALRRAPALILASLIPVLILYGMGKLIALVPNDLMLGNGKVRWGVRMGALGLNVLLQSFLVYTTAWIVLEGHKVLPALRDSVRVTARTFLPTLIVVGIPITLLYPLSYVTQRGELFLGKLRPEMLVGVLSLSIVGELVLSFLLAAAVTRLFLWRMEATR